MTLNLKARKLIHKEFNKDQLWLGILSALFLFNFNQIQPVSTHSVEIAPLLLISIDGFGWDYPNKFNSQTMFINEIMKNGVHAKKGIKNVFPTTTLVNLWTLVTGLYSESHGISSNYMYDPVLKKEFFPEWWTRPNHHNDYRFYDSGGEPIWVTSQLQNTNARTGSYMWFGGNQPVKWMQPAYHVDYEENIDFEEGVDTIVKWFSQENPINLGLLYIPEPDVNEHMTGIDSDETKKSIEHVDTTLANLFHKLEEKDLLDDINIIITSDHGFVNLPKSKYIMMDEIIPPHWYDKIIKTTPVFGVVPQPGMGEQLYQKLKEAADSPNSHFQVYKREDIPDKFHYKHNQRVPPIIAIAELEYSFIVNQTADEFKQMSGHGYDNEYQEMRPFFIATGPSFKKGFAVDTFNSVDIYPLMCHLLHLIPAPNNGSLAAVSSLLLKHETTMWTFFTYIIVLVVISSVGGLFLVAACRQHNYLKRKKKGAAYAKFLSDGDGELDNDDSDEGI